MSRVHPGRFHIAIPGPTNIPERILNAMHISSEDQRNPEIPSLTIPLYKDVKKVFQSEAGTVLSIIKGILFSAPMVATSSMGKTSNLGFGSVSA